MIHQRYVAWMLLTIGSAVLMTSYTNCGQPDDFRNPSSADLASEEPGALDISLAQIQINEGAIATNSQSVRVETLLTGATQIYLTEDPECLSGGNWTPLGAKASWQFSKSNQELTLYAKFKNSNSEETSCVSDSITHDDQAPTLTLLDMPATAGTDKSVVATFTGKDSLSGIKVFECAMDSEANYKTCTSPVKYTVKDGAHKLFVRALDKAGNVDAKSVDFKVDSTAPVVTFSKSPASETKEKEAAFEFTVEGSVSVKCKLDAATMAACTSPKSYKNLADGIHTFEIEAKDDAGNITNITKKWIVDTVVPTVKLTAVPAAINKLAEFAFKFEAKDATSDISKVECSVDAASYVNCGSLAGFDLKTIKVGKHSLKVRAVDKAGNKSDVVSAAWEREMDVAKVSSPVKWQVVQRNSENLANVPVYVALTTDVTKIRVRLLNSKSELITEKSYTRAESLPTSANITNIKYATAGGGWYQLQVSLYDSSNVKVAEKVVEKFGVGEVFLVTGEANSMRMGEKPIVNGALTSFAEYVDSTGKLKWRHDIDQAADSRGTTWSPFADRMASKLKVPVAVTMVGCGGTRVDQWLPEDKGAKALTTQTCVAQKTGGLYTRLLDAAKELRGFRAVLWHQGEADFSLMGKDASTLASYPGDFKAIVSQLNFDTEKTIPWIAATVSYIPGNEVTPRKGGCVKTGKPIQHLANMKIFRAMRAKIVTDKVALAGPDSDTYWGPYRGPTSNDCTHLSLDGQVGLGEAWATSVLKHFTTNKWGKVY